MLVAPRNLCTAHSCSRDEPRCDAPPETRTRTTTMQPGARKIKGTQPAPEKMSQNSRGWFCPNSTHSLVSVSDVCCVHPSASGAHSCEIVALFPRPFSTQQMYRERYPFHEHPIRLEGPTIPTQSHNCVECWFFSVCVYVFAIHCIYFPVAS